MSTILLLRQALSGLPNYEFTKTGDLEMKKQPVDAKKGTANDKENGSGKILTNYSLLNHSTFGPGV
jgi:hypothetical protein